MDAVLGFARAGLGVAIVPSMVAQNADPNLRVTPIAPPALHRTIALAHRSDVVLPRAAQEFRRTLLERTTPDIAKA
jgi:DNA-binding transcriptional LysR family regulator